MVRLVLFLLLLPFVLAGPAHAERSERVRRRLPSFNTSRVHGSPHTRR